MLRYNHFKTYTHHSLTNTYTHYIPLSLNIEKKRIITIISKICNTYFLLSGDRLILTYLEDTQFTRNEDIEVFIRYPAQGTNGYILSYVQIYADLSSTAANAYFVNGGIGQSWAEILVVANQTSNFGYQIYLYGF